MENENKVEVVDVKYNSSVNIEIVRDNFKYVFQMPIGVSYAEAQKVANQMVEAVGELAKIAEKSEEKPAEEVSAEVV